MSILGFNFIEIALFSAGVVYLVSETMQYFEHKFAPPQVPSYIPYLGHTRQLHTRAASFLAECREKYGNVYIIKYLGERVMVLSGQEASEMIRLPELEVKQSRNRFTFVYDAIGEWIGAPGLPEHRLDVIDVVKINISRLLKDVLPDVLAQVEESIDEQLLDLNHPIIVDSHAFFSKVVVSTVAVLLVGHDLAKHKQLSEIMTTYFSGIEAMIMKGLKWKALPLFGNFLAQTLIRSTTPSIKIRQQIKAILGPAFATRKTKVDPPSATNVLDSLVDEGHDLDVIAHTIMVLIFASVSTTTNTCSSLLGDLLANPKFIPRLKAEQYEVLKDIEVDGYKNITRQHIDRMVHLNSAIRETLRHRAHRLELFRSTSRSHILKSGIHIPKGAILALDTTSIHFDMTKYGTPDSSPFEYDPFRYVGTGLNATRVNSSFLSFGAGRHACPGRFFAVQEITAIMSALLRKCDFTTTSGKPGPFMTQRVFPNNYKVVFSKSTFQA